MSTPAQPLTTLIIFTRYPEPGKTKTRLIPGIGAHQAAQVQKAMTEHTLTQAQQWQKTAQSVTHQRQVEVHFAGGTTLQMQQWLGRDWRYVAQSEGGLGDRLKAAIAPHFTNTSGSVLTIGIDCPEIDADLLWQADTALQNHDVVIGPTVDGGYYLIGLRCWQPELFADIAWSTEQVFEQTCDRAQQLGLTVATLPTLRDVDYPEDLSVWEAVQEAAHKG